ncbi:uncharacterized protein [Dysidea avara]|uniref:uncharacterized protein isoform X2 n=1 Tax=Dysidea avara TaxID=196820 RepID=UPI00331BD0C8
MDETMMNVMTEPAPAPSPHKKKMNRAQQAKQTLSGLLVVSDVEIQEPNWCTTMLSSLLNDPSTHDVTFKTSDGGSVSAHRVIVAAGSPVLYEMLQDLKLEVDIDTVAFSSLIKYIYTGKVAINSSNLEKILAAASYFKVASLEINLVYCIANLLCAKNVVPITIMANDRKCEQLLERCVEFMCASASDVIRDPNFTKLPDRVILDFCKSSDLNVSELDLFLAVVGWQKHNKKAKAVIKNIFREIRYPLISNIDLVTKVGPTGLADSNLYTAALEYHVAAGQYKGPLSQLVERRTHGCTPSPMKSPTSNTTISSTTTVPQTKDYYVFPEPSAANQLAVSSDISHTTNGSASKEVVVKKKQTPSSIKMTPCIKKGTPGIKTEGSSIRMESPGIETKSADTPTQPPVVKKVKTESTGIATQPPDVENIKTESTGIAPQPQMVKTESTGIGIQPPDVRKVKTESTYIATPPEVKTESIGIATQPPDIKKVKNESTGFATQPPCVKKETSSIKKEETSANKKVVVKKKPATNTTKLTPVIKKETPSIKTESSSIKMEASSIKTESTDTTTQPPVVKKETSSIKKEETSGTPSVITSTAVHQSVITTATKSVDDNASSPPVTPDASTKVAVKKLFKRKRCKICEGCTASNCGECGSCLHPTWRKPCVKRICLNLQ